MPNNVFIYYSMKLLAIALLKETVDAVVKSATIEK
jgi:hypothetical protein